MLRHGLPVLAALTVCWAGSQAASTRASSPLSTHILDTTVGRPAADVSIAVFSSKGGEWVHMENCTTDGDGRCADLLAGQNLQGAGTYKLCFTTQPYFDKTNTETFFPYIEVIFRMADPSQHYHVPLLLNPYSYSTYRGS